MSQRHYSDGIKEVLGKVQFAGYLKNLVQCSKPSAATIRKGGDRMYYCGGLIHRNIQL